VKVNRIHHHSVNIEGRLDEAAAFYGDLLGLDVEPSRPDIPGIAGRWFRVGDAQLHLVDADAGTDSIRPTAAHVCLAVESIQDAVDRLDAAGVPYLTAAQGPVMQVFLADPSGNMVELQQDRAAGTVQ
jgi:catechol 2,3-dioxygenase-like lactoylglutathione lyase family enzyme